jgi:group I intron endonuclease
MPGIVYCHTNKINGKVYVGQTWRSIEVRKGTTGYKKNPYFDSAIQKYGWDGFDHRVLSAADTQESLDNLEKLWIVLLKATNHECGYNIRAGGNSGGRLSEQTKHKLSLAHLGKTLSAETRK